MIILGKVKDKVCPAVLWIEPTELEPPAWQVFENMWKQIILITD